MLAPVRLRLLVLATLLLLPIRASAQTVEEDLAKIARIHREMQELTPSTNAAVPPTAPGLVNPEQQRRAAARQYNALQADSNARRNSRNQVNIDQALPGLENRQGLRDYDPQRADDFRRAVDDLHSPSPNPSLQNRLIAPPGAPNSPASSDPQRRDDAQRAIDEQRFTDQRNRLSTPHP